MQLCNKKLILKPEIETFEYIIGTYKGITPIQIILITVKKTTINSVINLKKFALCIFFRLYEIFLDRNFL